MGNPIQGMPLTHRLNQMKAERAQAQLDVARIRDEIKHGVPNTSPHFDPNRRTNLIFNRDRQSVPHQSQAYRALDRELGHAQQREHFWNSEVAGFKEHHKADLKQERRNEREHPPGFRPEINPNFKQSYSEARLPTALRPHAAPVPEDLATPPALPTFQDRSAVPKGLEAKTAHFKAIKEDAQAARHFEQHMSHRNQQNPSMANMERLMEADTLARTKEHELGEARTGFTGWLQNREVKHGEDHSALIRQINTQGPQTFQEMGFEAAPKKAGLFGSGKEPTSMVHNPPPQPAPAPATAPHSRAPSFQPGYQPATTFQAARQEHDQNRALLGEAYQNLTKAEGQHRGANTPDSRDALGKAQAEVKHMEWLTMGSQKNLDRLDPNPKPAPTGPQSFADMGFQSAPSRQESGLGRLFGSKDRTTGSTYTPTGTEPQPRKDGTYINKGTDKEEWVPPPGLFSSEPTVRGNHRVRFADEGPERRPGPEDASTSGTR